MEQPNPSPADQHRQETAAAVAVETDTNINNTTACEARRSVPLLAPASGAVTSTAARGPFTPVPGAPQCVGAGVAPSVMVLGGTPST